LILINVRSGLIENKVSGLLQVHDDRLNDIIAQTYDASLGNVSWELAMKNFAILLDAQQCAVSIFDRELKTRTFSITAFQNNEYHRQFDDYFDSQRYLTRLYAENDIFRATDDTCDEMSVRLPLNGRFDLNLILHRAKFANSFSDQDEAYLRRFYPHVKRAFDVWCQYQEKTLQLSSLFAATERLYHAVGFLDSEGRLLFGNQMMQDLLSVDDGLRFHQSRVQVHCPIGAKFFKQAISTCVNAAKNTTEVVLIKRPSAKTDYIIEVISVNADLSGTVAYRPSVMVIVKDLDFDGGCSATMLQKLYDLTDMEIRITQHLGQNKCEQDIADALSTSINTVKTHRKRIYSKLSVEGKAALVDLLKRIG